VEEDITYAQGGRVLDKIKMMPLNPDKFTGGIKSAEDKVKNEIKRYIGENISEKG
jgi:hypothetical protein